MDLGLTDQVVLVTGGAAGIGRAIVQAFAREGAHVVVVDRDDANGQDGVAVAVRGELAEHDTCRRAVDAALRHFGRIGVLVHNAGRNDGVGLEAGPAAFVQSLQQNLVPAYTLTHLCRDALIVQRGAIVNIASKVAVTGQGGTSGYAAAKGGLLALTREWALEFAPHGVRVNAVVPAEVDTPLYAAWLGRQPDPARERDDIESSIPLGTRLTMPDEIAATVVFLASARSSHTTGQWVFVDGGYTHLDRRAT